MGRLLAVGCAACAECGGGVIPVDVVENGAHVFGIGQLWSCECGKSTIWTNSIRNEYDFIRHLDKKSPAGNSYYQGFCNDLYCGQCLSKNLLPMENGVREPWLPKPADRYGCESLLHNQGVLVLCMGKEESGWLEKWYSERSDKIRSMIPQAEVGQNQANAWVLRQCKFASDARPSKR